MYIGNDCHICVHKLATNNDKGWAEVLIVHSPTRNLNEITTNRFSEGTLFKKNHVIISFSKISINNYPGLKYQIIDHKSTSLEYSR